MTPEMQKAVAHVQTIFPQVTHVFVSAQGKWFFCDDNFDAPVFGGAVDVSLLEDAVDSLVVVPASYYIGGENG